MKYDKKLISWTPRSLKPHSAHCVVLVIEDHKRKGTFGVCINRPAMMLPCTCGECPVPKVPLFLGGPKGIDERFFLLHDQPLAADKRDKVLDGVFFSCPMALDELGKGKGKMITGYFHWLPGELEEEVRDGWWSVENKPTHDLVMLREPREVWSKLASFTDRLYPSAN